MVGSAGLSAAPRTCAVIKILNPGGWHQSTGWRRWKAKSRAVCALLSKLLSGACYDCHSMNQISLWGRFVLKPIDGFLDRLTSYKLVNYTLLVYLTWAVI